MPAAAADDRRGARRDRGSARRRRRADLGRRLAHGRHQHRTRADAGRGRGAADRRPGAGRGRPVDHQGQRRPARRRGHDRPPRQHAQPARLLLAHLHLGNGGGARRRVAERGPGLRPGRSPPRGSRSWSPPATAGCSTSSTRASWAAPAWCRPRRARDGRGPVARRRPRSARELAEAIGAALAAPLQPPPARSYPAELRIIGRGRGAGEDDGLRARRPADRDRHGLPRRARSRASTASSPSCCPPGTTRGCGRCSAASAACSPRR